ncbi:MAG: N-acetyltransferase family protein [Arenibacterium sp.]
MITVRPMRAGDVPEAAALLNDIIARGGTTAHQNAFDLPEFTRAFLTGPWCIACHVALDGAGRIAGFQSIETSDKLPEGCADIASFARLAPKLRGVGRAMFPATCQAAREAGYSWLNATIRADNVEGLGYYSAMGFADHEVQRDVPLADGRKVDRISKRFALDNKGEATC